ncbi:MAG: putative RNA-binding protein, contains TRAM domain protein [uncultured archaeon A07HR60]|nr:MAG: putative RNA-binding protein, contains TRAM domain protein [uncultured archaeon A07HR60]
MVELSESLQCLFTASVEDHDESYRVEIPGREVDLGSLSPGETYRVAILPSPEEGEVNSATTDRSDKSQTDTGSNDFDRDEPPEPPVTEGETRRVEIEALGEQGDGIAKIERGYVVIVPGTSPGDEVFVEISTVRTNVSFAEPVQEPS